jgi:hypothetical protein
MNRKRVLLLAAAACLGWACLPRVYAAGGVGAAGISGYAVSDVHYAVTGSGLVSGVSFRLDGIARTVRVRLSPSEEWHDCAVTGRRAACAFPRQAVQVQALRALAVTAAS